MGTRVVSEWCESLCNAVDLEKHKKLETIRSNATTQNERVSERLHLLSEASV